MYHLDAESNGEFGHLFQHIVVNGNDANEKVHLRQWYVPKYPEPRGCVWTEQEIIETADIVKEYTWVLLDTNNDPILGKPKPALTSFIWPIADVDPEQCGLDSYDAARPNDQIGHNGANRTVLNTFRDNFPGGDLKTIDLSTSVLTIPNGEVIEFLDHKAMVEITGQNSAIVTVYYGGNNTDHVLDQIAVNANTVLTAGRHAVHKQKTVDEPDGIDLDFFNASTWKYLQPVLEPWYLEVVDISANSAFLRAGRLIQSEETYFVDGAEYDVAALFGYPTAASTDYYDDTPDGWDPPRPGLTGEHDKLDLKYITIRNPIPKYDEVILEGLTITKCALQEGQPIPMLPPFNMVHDVIDDVNIPEDINETKDDNPVSRADEQYPDNPAGPDVDSSYNTIAERRVMDVDPVIEYFIEETKEPRFDTNLFEEKFTCAPEEEWQWINIETLPWDYTELVLPEQTDITGTGDYILVSSFVAPNSAHDSYDPVRVKFAYDATDGTGIYVNTTGVVVQPLDCDANGPYEGMVDEMIDISGSASGGTMPYEFHWDLDDDGQYDDATGQDVSYSWATPGTKTIGMKVVDSEMNECTDTAMVDVMEFDPWMYDEDESGVIEIDEVLAAIADYFLRLIDVSQVLGVIAFYFS
jgi:hypothetical protein